MKKKKGEAYGWPIAIYTKPENIYGRNHVASLYSKDPIESGKAIANHIMEVYPIATSNQIRIIIGGMVGHASKSNEGVL